MPGVITLKEELLEKQQQIRDAHRQGAGGMEICSALSESVDELVIELLESYGKNFSGAIVPLGGYGRGILNPCSDVDILFLIKGEKAKDRPPAKLLAVLWDTGLKIGHSTRTVADTISVGLSDITARTAMSETRFLAGDLELYEEFRKKYARKVIRHKPEIFITEKEEEMYRRHKLYGERFLLTEPNIKESPGGLRDFQTAIWMIRCKSEISTLDDMVQSGIINNKEASNLGLAYDELLRLRNGIHFKAGKSQDVLSHPIQPEIAKDENMGVGSDNEISARLLRKYYKSARPIARFASQMVHTAREYRRKRFFRTVYKDKDGLYTDGTWLFAGSFPPESCDKNPEMLFRIGRRLAEEGLTVSPNLYKGLKTVVAHAPESWFCGENGGRLLLSLLRLKKSADVLRLYRDVGIIGRLIPEFEEINGLSQFDMFHRFSVDEHIITAIERLENLTNLSPVSTHLRDIYRSHPELEIIKLAILLHDLGKRAEDHHITDEESHTAPILKRLGLDPLIERVRFLVSEHIEMSVTAQRHDFSDQATLKHFCEKVGNRQNLIGLYLLTFADINAVGPGIWNEWKDRLLASLFEQAALYLIEGEKAFDPKAKEEAVIKELVEDKKGKTLPLEMVTRFLAYAPEQYLLNSDPEHIEEDITLVDSITEDHPVCVRFGINPGDETGKITVAAKEKLGLFSAIAGIFAMRNVDVVEAQIYSLSNKIAVDTFIVEGNNLSMFSEARSLEIFRQELEEHLYGNKDVDELVVRRTRYMTNAQKMGDGKIEPEVAIINYMSESSSVIEVFASDRIGLLYDITRSLARLDIDIMSAKISTEGPKAINVFYVTSADGSKITDETTIRRVRSELEKALKTAL